jgi:hypothetical protein
MAIYQSTTIESLIKNYAIVFIKKSHDLYAKEKEELLKNQDGFLLNDPPTQIKYYRRLSLLNTKITVMTYALNNSCFRSEFSFSNN